MRDAEPPASGFERVELGGAFATANGPLYARWHDEHLQIGFRVGPAHVNPGQNCHGGMLCTFADILISTAAQYQTDIPRQFLPTISLQVDFLAGAPLGSWVQGQADILRVTRNLVFSQGLIEADGEAVMRASGVFRRGHAAARIGGRPGIAAARPAGADHARRMSRLPRFSPR